MKAILPHYLLTIFFFAAWSVTTAQVSTTHHYPPATPSLKEDLNTPSARDSSSTGSGFSLPRTKSNDEELQARLVARFPRLEGKHISEWQLRHHTMSELKSAFGSDRIRSRTKGTAPSTSASAAVSSQPDSFQQAWVRQYSSFLVPSGDFAYAMTTDAQGNIYVTGESDSTFTYIDIVTRKYSSLGNLIWQRRYNGPASMVDGPSAITVGTDGNVYVIGYDIGLGTGVDYVTIKYSSSGDLQWAARYNYSNENWDFATSVAVDKAGNVYVGGGSGRAFTTAEETFFDYATVKYNRDGVQQWVARYNGSLDYDDGINALSSDSLGNVYVTGLSNSNDGGPDIVTIKYDSNGVEQWVNKWSGSGSYRDEAYAIGIDQSLNVYVSGYSYDASSTDYVTIKYKPDGIFDWIARYDGPGHYFDVATTMKIDKWSNIYVSGRSDSANFDFCTIKYDSSGAQKWIRRFNGGYGDDAVTSMVLDSDGNVYVAGQSLRPGNQYDLVAIKYRPDGSTGWQASYSDDDNGDDFPNSIALDYSRNVIIAGTVHKPTTYFDWEIVKLSPTGAFGWASLYNGVGVGNDWLASMSLDPVGNVYLCIENHGANLNEAQFSPNIVTQKYGPDGILKWSRTFPGNTSTGMVTDKRGNAFVLGYDILVKYDSNGVQKWIGTLNGSLTNYALTIDSSGNAYVAGSGGTAKFDSNGNRQMILSTAGTGISSDSYGNITLLDGNKNISKFSPAGASLWSGVFVGSVADFTLDEAGNTYAIGKLNSQFKLSKFGPAGNTIWTVTAPFSEYQRQLVVDGSMNIYALGDSWVTKYNSDGIPLWSSEASFYGAVTVDDCDNAYVAYPDLVDQNGFDQAYDITIKKLNPSGEEMWRTHWDTNTGGHSNDFYVRDIRVDKQGNIYVGAVPTIGSGITIWASSVTKYNHVPKLELSQSLLPLGNVNTTCAGTDTVTLYPSGCTNPDAISIVSDNFDFSAQILDVSHSLRESISLAVGFAPTSLGSQSANITLTHVPTGSSTILQVNGTGVAMKPSYSTNNITFTELGVGCLSETPVMVKNFRCAPLNFSTIVSTDSNFTSSIQSGNVPPLDSMVFNVIFQPLSIGPKIGYLRLSREPGTAPDSILVSGSAVGSGSELIVRDSLGTGWQLFSLPFNLPCPRQMKNSFYYDGRYYRSDTLVYGRGYWKKLTAPILYFAGTATDPETIFVVNKWNIVGSSSSSIPLSNIATDPPGIIQSNFYGYSSAGYASVSTLEPGRGYWVKTNADGKLILQGSLTTLPKPSDIAPEPRFNFITITDAKDHSQTLFFTGQQVQESEDGTFELPPKPPEGIFDARFASGRMLEAAGNQRKRDFPILISAAESPVTVSWGLRENVSASLVIDTKEINLNGKGLTQIANSESNLLLRLDGRPSIPSVFSLGQNYPNPFNPITRFEYALPENTTVRLRIVDVLGHEVATLVDGYQDAGYKSIEFNAERLSSGIYFYMLDTPKYRAVKKMLLLK